MIYFKDLLTRHNDLCQAINRIVYDGRRQNISDRVEIGRRCYKSISDGVGRDEMSFATVASIV